MKIALITFDENLQNKLINSIGEAYIQAYVDSISLLKDIENLKPSIIIYDASAGDFAIDDLKFLLSKEKLKGKEFKVLYSEENPIKKKEIEAENISFYEKTKDLDKLIKEILDEISNFEGNTEYKDLSSPIEINENFQEQIDNTALFSSPEDIESLYNQEGNNLDIQNSKKEEIPGFEDMFSDMTMEDFSNIETPITESVENNLEINNQDLSPSLEIPEIEEVYSKENLEKEKPITEKQKETISSNVPINSDIISFSLNKEEIKEQVIKLAVDKLVSLIKEDPDIKQITENIQKDFVERLNKELENLKEEIRAEVKGKILGKIEEEITNTLKQDLKDYIADITAKIVKEKLNQIFNK